MPSIDLTIPLTALDTEDLLSDWRWRIPADFVPIQMTKFGDWFFGDPQQRIYMLDLLEGTLLEVAPSLAAYNELKNSPEKQGEWFLDAFVFRCASEGLHLEPGQCYGWKVHPMIGGKIALEDPALRPLLARKDRYLRCAD